MNNINTQNPSRNNRGEHDTGQATEAAKGPSSSAEESLDEGSLLVMKAGSRKAGAENDENYPTGEQRHVYSEAVTIGDRVTTPPNLITPESDTVTPEMLPLIDLNQSDIDRIVSITPGGLSNIQDIYSLSPSQEGILARHLMAKDGDPCLHFVYMSFERRESLDQYLTTVQTIIDRHDILRTSFVWENLSAPAQVVWREASLSITELQLDPVDRSVTEQLKQMFGPSRYRMDLTQAPLLRFIVAQESDSRWILLKLLHHLISDHSTLDVMQSEIQVFSKGQGASLPPAQPYRNLVAQARLGVTQEAHERFFKEMLEEIDTPSIPFGITVVHDDGSHAAESRRILSHGLSGRLRTQAKRLGVSLVSLCHVACAQVIARTSEQQRVVFGTALFGSMWPVTGSDGAMGPFTNILPIRIDLDRDSAEESARRTHGRLASLLEHEHALLALAQRCSNVAAGLPLFSALFNYHHSPKFLGDSEVANGMRFLESEQRTNYPFCLTVEDYGITLGLTAQVVQPLESGRICGYMQEALDGLTAALEHNSSISVGKLEVLPRDERQMLLRYWNATRKDYPADLCLHGLFERQVECTPSNVAVVHGTQSLTYSELNIRSNRLAHKLIQIGVKPESLVAICVERSFSMVVGILAILKAGGAYVPLDPSHASDRLRDILGDTTPVCVVADGIGRTAIGDIALASLSVMDPDSTMADLTCNPWIPILNSHHLAYVIFTSGTTGKPKGVMIEHQGVVNLMMSRQEYWHVQTSSRISQFFSVAFDGSVCEIFGTLCFGGSLHLLQDDTRLDCQKLWHYLEQHRITHSILPPAVLQGCEDLSPLSTMSRLAIAGESLSANLARKVHKLVLKGTIINEYGPTEITVAATSWIYSEDSLHDIAPIGRPLANKTVYLLDELGDPVPLGAVGELYVGGVGVARGYLNRPDLTPVNILSDPFSEEVGSRMYKTRDTAKYLPDGNIVCLGRNDHQVKIRGFRIELGDIEAQLMEHPLVSEALVVAIGEGSNKRLIAYVIDRHDARPKQVANTIESFQLALSLRCHLTVRLPVYMVPAAFVRIDAFPLTANGKLNRRALPAPEDYHFAYQEYEAPQGEIEKALAAIWTELLNVQYVGRNDSFFALGGHSLLAVRLLNRITNLGAHIPLSSLFNSPSLGAFASVVSESIAQETARLPTIKPVPRGNIALPLSSAQQRLWFLAQLDGVGEAYYIPTAFRIHGHMDQSAWRQAWDDVYGRHEALRSVFVNNNGYLEVRILPSEGNV
ncbi:hypothetical protein BGX28_007834 [Mortierella sp. GBA30]|nr:hypothetical protein BGX28_007834 [Mortierella sp. GBA30]